MPNLTKINSKGAPVKAGAKTFAGVLDEGAKLIWDPRETKAMTHAAAEEYIADLNKREAGMNWRLPTVDELFALADRSTHSPAIDKTFFPKCHSDWYWTSTPAAVSPADYAWFVDFSYGRAPWFNRGNRAFVRAVRPQ